ncbi:MAG: MoaD/ThiS family protein [Candidatus Bathyarchaeia archaeon]
MPKINIKFATYTRDFIGGKKEVTLELPSSSTINNLIEELSNRFERSFKEKIIDSKTGKLQQHVIILVNGREITFLKGLETVLNENDEVAFIPPFAGGSLKFIGDE